MITVDPSIKAALAQYNIVPVTLIEIEWSASEPNAGGTLRITDSPRDITINGVTYPASAILKGLTPPRTQSTVDRDQYRLQLADPDGAIRSRVEVQPSGVPMSVQLTFVAEDLDDNNNVKLLPNTMDVYRGFLSGSNLGYESGAPVYTLTFTGQISQLSASRPRLTSQESQQEFSAASATDTAFNYVHTYDTDDILKWGRA